MHIIQGVQMTSITIGSDGSWERRKRSALNPLDSVLLSSTANTLNTCCTSFMWDSYVASHASWDRSHTLLPLWDTLPLRISYLIWDTLPQDTLPLDIRPGNPFTLVNLRPYHPLLLTSGGHHWKAFQTCSLQDLPSLPNWYWRLVVATGAGVRYTSYWNIICK